MKNFDQEVAWIVKDKYGGRWRPEVIKDIQRLRAGEPTDYIVGWMPFLNCRLDLSQKPFIPRPETEYWVECFIEKVKMKKEKLRVLDLFSGSGCIGIAIVKNLQGAKVDFAELNPKFVKQIKINLKLNKLKGRVFRSDGLAKIRGKYDFILANPPYVPLKNKAGVSQQVLKYEPRAAVFGGPNGLMIIKKFILNAKNNLEPNGEVWMEFDSQEKPAIAKLIRQVGYSRQQFHKDQYGRWRWVVFGI